MPSWQLSLAHCSLGSCPEALLCPQLRHAVACRSITCQRMCQTWAGFDFATSIAAFTSRQQNADAKDAAKHMHGAHAHRPKVLDTSDARIRHGIVFDRARLQSPVAPSTNKETPFLDQPQAFLGDRLLLQHVTKLSMSVNNMNVRVNHHGTKTDLCMQADQDVCE